MPLLKRITGQFGYTHKDHPEEVYELSRVKLTTCYCRDTLRVPGEIKRSRDLRGGRWS